MNAHPDDDPSIILDTGGHCPHNSFEAECPACDADLFAECWGATEPCPSCGVLLESDFDYIDAYEGSMAFWLTIVRPK